MLDDLDAPSAGQRQLRPRGGHGVQGRGVEGGEKGCRRAGGAEGTYEGTHRRNTLSQSCPHLLDIKPVIGDITGITSVIDFQTFGHCRHRRHRIVKT